MANIPEQVLFAKLTTLVGGNIAPVPSVDQDIDISIRTLVYRRTNTEIDQDLAGNILCHTAEFELSLFSYTFKELEDTIVTLVNGLHKYQSSGTRWEYVNQQVSEESFATILIFNCYYLP